MFYRSAGVWTHDSYEGEGVFPPDGYGQFSILNMVAAKEWCNEKLKDVLRGCFPALFIFTFAASLFTHLSIM
jgi:hypothetical protein